MRALYAALACIKTRLGERWYIWRLLPISRPAAKAKDASPSARPGPKFEEPDVCSQAQCRGRSLRKGVQRGSQPIKTFLTGCTG